MKTIALAVCLLLLAGACRSAAPAADPSSAPPPAPAAPAADEGGKTYKNKIKWATATEMDNFGYDVYRSRSEDGPFERLNPDVIEGAGTTDEPTRYEYVDDTIDPRRTYYYYVESISMAGVRERFTPIGEAPPKIPPRDDGDTEPE